VSAHCFTKSYHCNLIERQKKHAPFTNCLPKALKGWKYFEIKTGHVLKAKAMPVDENTLQNGGFLVQTE